MCGMQILGRSLFCLGLLLRYGYGLMASSDAPIEISKILGLLKRFLLVEDFSLKVRALQVCFFPSLVCSVIFFLCSMVTMRENNSCKVNHSISMVLCCATTDLSTLHV
jgi:hypothetical protein